VRDSALACGKRGLGSSDSKQFSELIGSEPGLSQQGAQRSSVQFTMVRYGERRRRIGSKKDHVAPARSIEREPDLRQHLDEISTRDDREFAHTQSTWVSKSSTGIACPWAFIVSIQPSIASRMLAIASAFVAPWLIHPGMDGHSTIHPESSPGRRITCRTSHTFQKRESVLHMRPRSHTDSQGSCWPYVNIFSCPCSRANFSTGSETSIG